MSDTMDGSSEHCRLLRSLEERLSPRESPLMRLDGYQKMALVVCLIGLLLSEVFGFLAGAYFGAGHPGLLGFRPVAAQESGKGFCKRRVEP